MEKCWGWLQTEPLPGLYTQPSFVPDHIDTKHVAILWQKIKNISLLGLSYIGIKQIWNQTFRQLLSNTQKTTPNGATMCVLYVWEKASEWHRRFEKQPISEILTNKNTDTIKTYIKNLEDGRGRLQNNMSKYDVEINGNVKLCVKYKRDSTSF